MVDSDGPGVTEIVVRDLLRMQFVNSSVDVQIGLEIVVQLTRTLEFFSSLTHTVR